jgi:putative endonuclease
MSRANEVSRGTVRNIPNFGPGWCCYLLLCSDGSYYCGIASNLATRVRDHASGKGSGYTKEIKPVALVRYDHHTNRRASAPRNDRK